MNYRLIFLPISLALAVGLFLHPPNAEGLDPKIIDAFIKEGDLHYSKKEMGMALASYSRAFLLDPQRRDAREKLLSLTETPLLSSSQRSELLRLRDLMATLNTISRQLTYYDEKLGAFIGDLVSRGTDKRMIDRELKRIEQENWPKDEKEVQALYSQEDDPLNMIIASVEEKRLELFSRQQVRSQQFERLRQISKKETPSQSITLAAADLLARPVLTETRFVGRQGAPVTAKNKEVVDLSLQVTEGQQKLKDKDQQIDALKEQLEQSVEQVRFNEKLIHEKNDELLSLNQKLADYEAQLTFRQKMVDEKEANAKQMEAAARQNEVTQENESLKATLGAKARENAQLERMLNVSDEKIAELQQGFDRQPHGGFRWFWEKSDEAKESDDQTARSEQMDLLTAPKFKKLVKERDQAIEQKDQQITELMGIVDIYKDLLKEAKASSVATGQDMKNLQNELAQVKEQFSEKNKHVLEAEYNLMSLKKELTNVQTRLVALRNLPETKNYSKMENEMNELEDKLNNIHKFLLKQLDDFERLNKDYVAGDIEDVDKVLDLNIDRIERK